MAASAPAPAPLGPNDWASASFTKVTRASSSSSGRNRRGGGGGGSQPSAVPVKFNPESLQYDASHQFKQDQNTNRVQYVTSSNAKLSLDLTWDSTDTGEDVRKMTDKLLQLMKPEGQEGASNRVPTCVKFEWGSFAFTGYMESYKEVLDFFSYNGVPLRAKTSVVLVAQDHVFDSRNGNYSTTAGNGNADDIGEVVPTISVWPSGGAA
ncbi:MAG TPA: hypothetical protein PLA94_07540, partial [Myxococcota bacterium]|nr:hypothetical protein [Myxococcota bacterium]